MSDTLTDHSGLRARVQAFMDRASTKNFILGVILFNAIILGLETVQPVMEVAGPLILTLDTICLSIFVIELTLKLYAQRLSFFRSGWNIFDFVIVAVALVPASQGLSVLRALRILRLLRVLSVAPAQVGRVKLAIARRRSSSSGRCWRGSGSESPSGTTTLPT